MCASSLSFAGNSARKNEIRSASGKVASSAERAKMGRCATDFFNIGPIFTPADKFLTCKLAHMIEPTFRCFVAGVAVLRSMATQNGQIQAFGYIRKTGKVRTDNCEVQAFEENMNIMFEWHCTWQCHCECQ